MGVRPLQPEGPARRALVSRPWLPPLVLASSRHRHGRDPVGPDADRLAEAAARDGVDPGRLRPGPSARERLPAAVGRIGDRSIAAGFVHVRRASADGVSPATRWRRPCSRTASPSSGGASTSAGRGASSAIGSEEPNALVSVGAGVRARTGARDADATWSTDWRPGRCAAWARCPAAASDRADHRHAHCEVLVVGGGWAGVEAARAAAESGDRRVDPRRRRARASAAIPQRSQRVTHGRRRRRSSPARRRSRRYDDNLVLVVERHAGRLADARAALAHPRATGRRRHRRLRATARLPQQRPAGRDAGRALPRPTSNASALRRVGATVVFTNNDSAYHAALALRAAGIEIAGDRRRPRRGRRRATCATAQRWPASRCARGMSSPTPTATTPSTGVTIVGPGRPSGRPGADRRATCSRCRAAGTRRSSCTRYPGRPAPLRRRDRGVRTGGVDRAERRGRRARPNGDGLDVGRIEPLWVVPPAVDDDGGAATSSTSSATRPLADLRDAVGRGLRYPEHVKRWTTIGTGNDQGRTSAVNEVGILVGPHRPVARRRSRRPRSGRRSCRSASRRWPGRYRGDLFDPIRPTPAHESHVALGALFENVGQWKRAWAYPTAGRELRRRRPARVSGGPRGRRHDGRLDPRQDRRPGQRRRRCSSTAIYTNAFSTLKVGHAATA